MSIATKAHDVATLDKTLNDRILAGDILGAFDEFYAPNVVMQENNTEPFAGKEVNRERELKFLASVEKIHKGAVLASAVNGDVTFSQWEMDIAFKGGNRVKMEQVAVRHWENGKVVQERFYYKG